VIEEVTVEYNQHALPGMLEVNIQIRAVISPAFLKDRLTEIAYGPKGKLEQFLRLALPYTNDAESLQKVISYTNKIISKNRPQNPGGAKS